MRQAEADALAELCREINFGYKPVAELRDIGGSATLPMFQNYRSYGEHLMTGAVDGIPVKLVTMISATTISNHCESSQTIALLSAPRPDLPRFRLSAQAPYAGETYRVPGPVAQRTTFGTAGLPDVQAKAAVAQFRRGYSFYWGSWEAASPASAAEKAESKLALERFFSLELVRFFADNPGWEIESDGTHIAIWRHNKDVENADRRTFVDETLTVWRGISQHGSAGHRLAPLTKSAIVQVTMALGITGAGVGAVIGHTVSLFDLMARMPAVMIGAVLGATLGLFLARQQPPPPASRIQVVESSDSRLVVYLPGGGPQATVLGGATLGFFIPVGVFSIAMWVAGPKDFGLPGTLLLGLGWCIVVGFGIAWFRMRFERIFLLLERNRVVLKRFFFGRKSIQEMDLGPKSWAELVISLGGKGNNTPNYRIAVHGNDGTIGDFGRGLSIYDKFRLVKQINAFLRNRQA